MNDTTVIVYIATIIITYLLGILTKRYPKISNKLIPIQNLCIGIVVFLVEWFITKEPSTALMLSGLTAGGIYDIIKNLNEIKGDD